MNKIKCIIVDDEPEARDIMEHLLKQIKVIEIVALCKNGLEAMDILNKTKIDLVFLDINMPDMSGIAFANLISKKPIKIIFTTAYREYAVDGFNLQAVDYLLKPISLERLMQSIQKYKVENSFNNIFKDYLIVRSDRKKVKINFNTIIFIESLGDYLKIHTTKNTIITRETISNIESRLLKKEFIRVHRSFIVSIPFIDSYTSEYIQIKKEIITMSRSYRDSFFRIMERE